MNDPKPLLNVNQMAKYLNYSPWWVYQNATSLGGIKVGGNWRFHADLPRIIAQQCAQRLSEHTNAPQANGAYGGEKQAPNAKNAATKPKTKPKTARPKSASSYAATFPLATSIR